jgi:HAD superfamily hydrolase (TIGR01662 family)
MERQCDIVMMCGFPASGKSTHVQSLCQEGYTVLSRDALGGNVQDLLPLLENHSRVVLDNTHLTKKSRKPFVDFAKSRGIPIRLIWLDTTIEDCQIRLMKREWDAYNKLFLDGKGPKKDPHVYPAAVLFKARKDFEQPTCDEGIDEIQRVKVPSPTFPKNVFRNKCLFLDIDGTLRKTDHLVHKYPTRPEEATAPAADIDVMRTTLYGYIEQGYLLCGVSNQSGIFKGLLTPQNAEACFDATREMLGLTKEQLPILYCPHKAAPISCFCRKPQMGMGLHMIFAHKLRPSKCIMVGDKTTDKTFATRLGMQFVSTKEFWSTQ